MAGRHLIRIPVVDPSQVGEARRVAGELSRTAFGFGEQEAATTALIATELASNLVKHGSEGMLLLGRTDDSLGIDLIALDRGPGMPDVERCLTDGFSTAGSAGTGLGAVARLSSLVDIYTRPGGGTALLARFLPPRRAAGLDGGRFGSVSIPKPGESACGDTWGCERSTAGWRVVVADGLGHGTPAAQAAAEALRLFRDSLEQPVERALEFIHLGMRPTRGAAIALADVRPDEGRVVYGGIGNVAATILSQTARRYLVSLNGTAGHSAPRIRAFEYDWGPGSVLLVHTDGLRTQWDLAPYGDLLSHHPALVASVLVRDFWRLHDDVTVTVFRQDAVARA